MNLAIIGCGLIGQKRMRACAGKHCLIVAADDFLERAQAVAAQAGLNPAGATVNWREAVSDGRVDAVIVATTNEWLAPITLFAVEAGKHVLVEKPGARTAAELDPVLAAAQKQGVCVWVGFNHRFHPAIQKAREIFAGGALGPLMFLRARYGHGGRLGYEKEWRADPARSGGGELIDQGVHLIDLARWFLGDFQQVCGFAPTYFWDMPVDDNAFLFLRTERNQAAWLHASSTEWKNLFSFELYGQKAKLHIEGLGGSYGLERLSYYRMLPEMGPPETTIWEYPGPDTSWELELDAFASCVEAMPSRNPNCARSQRPCPSCTAGLENAQAVLRIVESVYRGATP